MRWVIALLCGLALTVGLVAVQARADTAAVERSRMDGTEAMLARTRADLERAQTRVAGLERELAAARRVALDYASFTEAIERLCPAR